MNNTKLPAWPTMNNTFAGKLADAEIAYWEARCRLLYAALARVRDYSNDPLVVAAVKTALRDCGPLPEEQK